MRLIIMIRKRLQQLLSTKDNKVDPDEAKEYIKYIKSEVGMKSFKSDIKETVSKLNKIFSVASYIQTRSGQDVLRISKMERDIYSSII